MWCLCNAIVSKRLKMKKSQDTISRVEVNNVIKSINFEEIPLVCNFVQFFILILFSSLHKNIEFSKNHPEEETNRFIYKDISIDMYTCIHVCTPHQKDTENRL